MATLDVFNMETPQQVQARISKERAKGLSGGSTASRRQARSNIFMDQLFGNKEVDAAQTLQNNVQAGLANAEQQFKDEGIEDPAQQQMLRLEAVRKSVQENNPGLALKLEDQIRTLRIADLERRKLDQTVKIGDDKVSRLNERFIFNPDTFKIEQVDIGTEEGKKRYDAAGEEGLARSDDEGSLLNLFNAERARAFTAEQKRLEILAQAEQDALAEEGEHKSIPKTRRTQMQRTIEAQTQLTDAYRRAADLMGTPGQGTTEWMNRVDNFTMSIKELASAGLNADEIQQYTRFREIIAQTSGAANRLIKERSGAAVTEQEWERLKQELPTVHDSPSAFATKMQVMYDTLRRSNRRMDAAMQADDYTITMQDGENFASPEDFLFGQPKQDEQPAAPAAASGGFKILSVK